MDKYKVVFQIDEEERVGLALQNITNLINDIGVGNLEIEMVSKGEAVKSLVKGSIFDRSFEELAKKQVKFCACANTIRNLGIQKDKLFDFVTVVPSGVGELVKRQAEGWAYIRP
ncbi:MAG: DsrE family protein [Bacillota bacterium]|nr:DsrE family protein [Bacillota bacterium]